MIGYLVIGVGFAYFGGMKLLCDFLERKYWKK
jgi:hypothetical protein